MENERTQTRCPKCSAENPVDARFCCACGRRLAPRTQKAKRIDVKLSGAAFLSFICSLIALACFVPGLIAITEPSVLDPRSDLVNSIACVSILAGGLGMLLSITAFFYISISGGRVTGRGFAAMGLMIPPILTVVLCLYNIGRWGPTMSPALVCGTNLSGLGKAMLIYSNDYDNKLPAAGGPRAGWVARSPWWAADNREDAYGRANSSATDGRASISASLYLLVKYAEVTPKAFLCKGDYGTTEFKPIKYGIGNSDLIELWDFGPNPPIHCSYSYHLPYGPYPLTTSSEPGMAVAADRNPWIASPSRKARDFQLFDPGDNKEAGKTGNAFAHEQEGQNVLFLDSHVSFEKRAACGINKDNIYTYWDGENIQRGAPPLISSKPRNRLDSLLVNDPALPR